MYCCQNQSNVKYSFPNDVHDLSRANWRILSRKDEWVCYGMLTSAYESLHHTYKANLCSYTISGPGCFNASALRRELICPLLTLGKLRIYKVMSVLCFFP